MSKGLFANPDLRGLGLKSGLVRFQLSPAQLVEEALKNEEVTL